MDKTLFAVLNLNPQRNIAILGFLSNYPAEKYYIEGDSVIILGRSDHLWAHISSNSEAELSAILANHHSKTKYYFSVEAWMIPFIQKYDTIEWQMLTDRYILDPDIPLNRPNSEIAPIDKSFANFMYENSDYRDFISIEYIQDRLTKDISAGITINDKLVAWGFTHDDGALGFLHVLKDYRKKGYGLDILLGLIEKRKLVNKPIFGNIVPENLPSIKLLNKLGLKPDRRVSWIKVK